MSGKNPTSKAAELLRQTEQRFQELIGEASSAGRYPDVVRLASVAEEVGQLAERLSSGGDKEEPSSSSQKSPKPSGKKRKPRKKKRAKEYPKFFRSDDELVKVGWSKKNKKEYRHTAPRRLALPLAQGIVQAGGAGGKVVTDDFFPLEDPKDHSEVPSYQTYIVLAWLVEAGIVEKHGRQGYTLSNQGSFENQIEERWAKLPLAPS